MAVCINWNESGALLNETTGAYLARDVGATDTITLTDDGCLEAIFNIRVVETMDVRPSEGALSEDRHFSLKQRWIGDFQYEMAAGSQAMITMDHSAGDIRGCKPNKRRMCASSRP